MPLFRKFQYQVVANPIPIVAVPVPAFDYASPWSIPSKLKNTLAVALIASGLTYCPFIEPAAAVPLPQSDSTVPYSKYFLYQSIAEPVPFVAAEVVTLDKWYEPFVDPVRIKPGLRPSLQQSTAGLGNPIVPFGWNEPLVDPVRTKPGLKPGLQQTFTGSTQPFVSFSWFVPLSEPPKAKKPAQQQNLAWGYTTPGTVSLDEWYVAWRDPVRTRQVKPALQPYLAYSPFVAEVNMESKWHQPWSDPPKRKSLLPSQQQFLAFQYPVAAAETQYSYSPQVISFARYLIYQTIAYVPYTELVTVDKWFAPWREPVRAKPGLPARLQQTLAYQPYPFTPSTGWFSPWLDPARPRKPAIQQNTPYVPFVVTEQTDMESKWHQPWSEPPKRKFILPSQQQYLAAPPPAAIIQIQLSYSETAVPYSKYFLYQSIAEPPFVFERVTIDKWFAPWREPVRVKLGLRPSAQQFVAWVPFEQVSLDKWFAPWHQPVRVKLGLQTAAQPFIAHTPFVEVSRPDKWFAPWREPVRVKPGLRASLQQSLAFTVFIERKDQEDKWHRPWSEPVRVKLGLRPGLQQFQAYVRQIASNITLDLDATEIGDGFSGRINVIYCFHSLVSVVEIPAPDQADVASAVPASTFASVAIVEIVEPDEANVASTVPVATFASVSVNEVVSTVITSVSIIETC